MSGVFKPRFKEGVSRFLHGIFSRHAIGFRGIFHPAGLVGRTNNSLLGMFFDIFKVVCVRFVMFCVYIMLHGLQYVLGVAGWLF